MRRVHINKVPDQPCVCLIERPCVYRKVDKVCEHPRTNKGNSDAECWAITPKVLLWQLELIKVTAL